MYVCMIMMEVVKEISIAENVRYQIHYIKQKTEILYKNASGTIKCRELLVVEPDYLPDS
jgi:hypothetical protein